MREVQYGLLAEYFILILTEYDDPESTPNERTWAKPIRPHVNAGR